MVKDDVRKKIFDAGYSEAIFYDSPSFDNSIIGVDEDGRVVYDYDAMANEFVVDDYPDNVRQYREAIDGCEMSDSDIISELMMEAYDFIDCNTLRATPYMGSYSPVIVSSMDYMEEDENDCEYMDMVHDKPFTKKIVFLVA